MGSLSTRAQCLVLKAAVGSLLEPLPLAHGAELRGLTCRAIGVANIKQNTYTLFSFSSASQLVARRNSGAIPLRPFVNRSEAR